MSKLYKMVVTLRVIEQIEREAPLVSDDSLPESLDPVARDREELGGANFNKKILGILEKSAAAIGGGRPANVSPASSLTIHRTFDVPADSFDELMAHTKQVTDICLKFGTPSETGTEFQMVMG